MKVSCNIIRDILPLYAEDLASEDTKRLVDEHLCGCDECTRELGTLKKVQVIPVDADPAGLKKVKKTIVIRRIVAVMTALLMVLSIYTCFVMFLDAGIYLTAEQAVESVEKLDDGGIRIHWTDIGITATGSLGCPEDGDEGNFGIICRTRMGNLLFPKEAASYDELPAELKEHVAKDDWNAAVYHGVADQNVWFCDAKTGMGATLLWDAGNPAPTTYFQKVNYHIFWYLLILMALTAVFGLLSRIKFLPRVMRGAATAFGSIAFCVVVVTAGQFMELWGEFTECFINSAVLAIPVFLTCMCCWQLLDWRKQDKGM